MFPSIVVDDARSILLTNTVAPLQSSALASCTILSFRFSRRFSSFIEAQNTYLDSRGKFLEFRDKHIGHTFEMQKKKLWFAEKIKKLFKKTKIDFSAQIARRISRVFIFIEQNENFFSASFILRKLKQVSFMYRRTREGVGQCFSCVYIPM